MPAKGENEKSCASKPRKIAVFRVLKKKTGSFIKAVLAFSHRGRYNGSIAKRAKNARAGNAQAGPIQVKKCSSIWEVELPHACAVNRPPAQQHQAALREKYTLFSAVLQYPKRLCGKFFRERQRKGAMRGQTA